MNISTNFLIFIFDLQMFASAQSGYDGNGVSNINTTGSNTTGNDLSPEMKTFYDTALLQNAREELYHNQFGREQPLSSNQGRKVEWRRWTSFKKATTPLTEGVIPDGNKMDVKAIYATVEEYGDYTPISDLLEYTAVDPIIAEATDEHGAQAGATLDTLTRDVLQGTTSVFYAPKSAGGAVTTRAGLDATCKLTSDLVARVVTALKKNKAPAINGYYTAIIHPSVAYDLRSDPAWVDAHKYSSAKEIFNGEIGELHGCRFVETTEAKIYADTASTHPANLAVYGCLFFGKGAYGIVKPDQMSLEMLIKRKQEIGGPLNQFSTVGWKALHAAKILYPERIFRVECCSTFSETDYENYISTNGN